VRLRWDPPVDPNGEIVTYEVAYKLQKPDQVEEKKCIPVADYNQTAGYPLKLNEGLYSFRVRANSIAGYGEWTKLEYKEVEVGLKMILFKENGAPNPNPSPLYLGKGSQSQYSNKLDCWSL